MRSTIAFALLSLTLLPATAFAQASQPSGQQAAAQPSPAAASPASSTAGGITRDQYMHRAEERAARRAAAQFDPMSGNHNGGLDPSERRTWRSQHRLGA